MDIKIDIGVQGSNFGVHFLPFANFLVRAVATLCILAKCGVSAPQLLETPLKPFNTTWLKRLKRCSLIIASILVAMIGAPLRRLR